MNASNDRPVQLRVLNIVLDILNQPSKELRMVILKHFRKELHSEEFLLVREIVTICNKHE